MFKQITRGLAWLAACAGWALACWAIMLWRDLTWRSALIWFFCLPVALWLAWRARRAWVAWRLRSVARDCAARLRRRNHGRACAAVTLAWRGGWRRLRRAGGARRGEPLHALPWFLALGAEEGSTGRLLAGTGLHSPLSDVRSRSQSEFEFEYRSRSRSGDEYPDEHKHEQGDGAPAVLHWWYFERSIVIEPAARLVDAAHPLHLPAQWERLLQCLARTRRREPLNGIILTLDARHLLAAPEPDRAALAAAGRMMRTRLDALTRIFSARLPVYVVLTGCEQVSGFVEWARALPDGMCRQPFGVPLRATPGKGVDDFIVRAFGVLCRRLAAIRLEQGRHALPSDAVLFFPGRIARLRPALHAYLSPAFDASAYGETPLLSGLYLTGGGRETTDGWFSRGLFDEVLPAARDAREPLTRPVRFGAWRRLARHWPIVLWLLLAACTAALLSARYVDLRAGLAQAGRHRFPALSSTAASVPAAARAGGARPVAAAGQVIRPTAAATAEASGGVDAAGITKAKARASAHTPASAKFIAIPKTTAAAAVVTTATATITRLASQDDDASFAANLEALSAYIEADPAVSYEAGDWWPYGPSLRPLSAASRSAFCRAFEHRLLAGGVDRILGQRLAAVAASGDDGLVAAYAQHLVRRIGLLDAALHRPAGGDPDTLPPLGTALPAIWRDAVPGTTLSALDATRFGTLYAAYLRWQTDRGALAVRRAILAGQLARLRLLERPSSWLEAWADRQDGLAPLHYGDFWNLPGRATDPSIAAAYTADGSRAVDAFIDALGRASDAAEHGPDAPDALAARAALATLRAHYRTARDTAWSGFIDSFGADRPRLQGAPAWRAALALLLTPQDPYLALLHTVATTYRQIAQAPAGRPGAARAAAVPGWARFAMRLDRLWQTTRDNAAARRIGTRPARLLVAADAIGRDALDSSAAGAPLARLERTRALVRGLDAYRGALAGALAQIAGGDAQTAQIAARTYLFGADPATQETPLTAAARALEPLELERLPDEAPIWALMRGPLTFALDYAGRDAAAGLQRTWDAQVLAQLQGVGEPARLRQLLYADGGLVSTFMSGPAHPFVQRNATRYLPRWMLGQRVPLTGSFYGFVNAAQIAHANADASHARDAARLTDETARRTARTAALAALDQQIGAAREQAAQLRATHAIVILDTRPSATNPAAALQPQRSSLALQCASGATVLDNYNFASGAVFDWSLAGCGDVTLSVVYAGATLIRRWPGPQGFVDFLRATAHGQYRFEIADDPPVQRLLEPFGVKWVAVAWRQSGQAALLDAFARADSLTREALALGRRRAALQAEQSIPDGSAGSAFADDSAARDAAAGAGQALDLAVPAVIASAWGTPPVNQAQATSPMLEATPGSPGTSASSGSSGHPENARGAGSVPGPADHASPPPSAMNRGAPAVVDEPPLPSALLAGEGSAARR